MVFPDLDTVPHADTVARFLEEIPAENLAEVLLDTIRKLLRGKNLKSWLAREGYVLAIDGSLKWASPNPFAPEALRKRTGPDNMTYQAYVLEAVLVGPHGVSLPVLFEFCENDPAADAQTKQDSEQKAFRRLALRLKHAFPRVRFVVVLDGLYPNGPIMTLCRAYNWDFMIVLPDACLRTVWQEAYALHELTPEGLNHRWGDRDQIFWWVNAIDYTWQDVEGHYHHMQLHVVVCEETWQGSEGTQSSRWAWVSSVQLTPRNVVHRCNEMARRRWDIEENLLVEKRYGYHYEHLFSYDWNAMQGWHALLRLGHLLNTLSLHSVDLWPIYQTYGLQGTLKWLRETMMGPWLDHTRLALIRQKPARLRLIL